MARAIRNENNLLTMKLALVPGRSGSRVAIDFYRGRDRGPSMKILAEVLSIPESLTFNAVLEVHEQLFDPDVQFSEPIIELQSHLVALASERTGPEEPLWIQIGQGGNYLVTVPWEAIVRRLLGDPAIPIFRIPNFMTEPQLLHGPARIALCASSPHAKSPFDAGYLIQNVLGVLDDVVADAEIHVFTDVDAYHQVSGAHSESELIVHHPEEAEGLRSGTRTLRRPSGLRSPWLLWMRDALRDRRTDLVHFITPGFFTADLGGLALAHTPLGDEDRRRAHFISASEVNRFLNDVGAWASGFTVPQTDPWSIGVRIFAEQLARERSEPIMVSDSGLAGDDADAGLVNAYRFILGADPPTGMAGVSATVHPKRVASRSDEPDLPIVSVAQQDFAGFDEVGTAESSFERISTRGGTGRSARPTARWAASVQLDVEQSISKLAIDGIVTPEEQGEAAALDFLLDALDKTAEGEL